MNMILKATQYNWGLKYPGCWERKAWIIYDNGVCKFKEDFVCSTPVSRTLSVAAPELSRIRELRTAAWENDPVYACDGSAWTITAYESGKILQTTGKHPRYLYGTKVLEELTRLLPVIDLTDDCQE